MQPGGFSPDKKRRQSNILPYQAAAIDTQRPMIYKTDGTGRDTYISQNNGGFTMSNFHKHEVAMDPRVTFSKNLRSYERNGDYLARRNYN